MRHALTPRAKSSDGRFAHCRYVPVLGSSVCLGRHQLGKLHPCGGSGSSRGMEAKMRAVDPFSANRNLSPKACSGRGAPKPNAKTDLNLNFATQPQNHPKPQTTALLDCKPLDPFLLKSDRVSSTSAKSCRFKASSQCRRQIATILVLLHEKPCQTSAHCKATSSKPRLGSPFLAHLHTSPNS